MRNYYGRGVNAYVGLRGSGKTLELARECLALQSEGVKIATNFGFHSQDFALATVDDWLERPKSEYAAGPGAAGTGSQTALGLRTERRSSFGGCALAVRGEWVRWLSPVFADNDSCYFTGTYFDEVPAVGGSE